MISKEFLLVKKAKAKTQAAHRRKFINFVMKMNFVIKIKVFKNKQVLK